MNVLLLVAESLLFLVGSALLFRRERLYGIYFFLLYIYAIFTQIGYLYVPQLSASLYAYFGDETWRPVTLFVILSGVALLTTLWVSSGWVENWVHTTFVARVHVHNATQGDSLRRLGVRLVALLLLLQVIIFVFDFRSISWENAQQEDVFSATLALGLFILLVKLSVGSNLALYCLLREPGDERRDRRLAMLLAASLILFFSFTFKLGNRTDDIALVMGIVVYETSRIRLRPHHFAVAAGVAAILVAYLNVLESSRYEDGPADVDAATKILLKDYYWPAHILFAAVSNEVVMPMDVLKSNAGNALMFLGQPYLQAPVMDTFYPGGATRGASYGFYPFTEGYLFAGVWGVVYNGLVLGTLLAFWRALASTDSPRFNNYLLAILGSMLVNLVRGQSSYFFKYLYTFVMPNAALYLCLARQRFEWNRQGVSGWAELDPGRKLLSRS